MTFGLYKPGQGYWVRVLAAAMAGVLLLAASAWLWRSLQVIDPPISAWQVTVSPAAGAAQPGEQVVLLAASDGVTPAQQVATATVRSSGSEGDTAVVLLENVVVPPDLSIGSARQVAPGAGSPATLSGPIVGTPMAQRAFEALYIQAAGVGVLLLIGTIVIYWLVGVNARTAEFLIATDGEMKKVNWSTRKHVIDSTWVVIGYALLLSAGLFLVDTMFSQFFQLIRVLE